MKVAALINPCQPFPEKVRQCQEECNNMGKACVGFMFDGSCWPLR